VKDLLDFPPQGLQEFLASWNEPRYRAAQIIRAAWSEEFKGWMDATTLPLPLRRRLQEEFRVPRAPKPSQIQVSEDGTRKALFMFQGDAAVESVAILKDDRLTFCLSTQVGCAMGCSFCATAQLGFKRHLTCGEIVAQVLGLTELMKRRPTNLVLMGMGEPLQNLDSVRAALELLGHPGAWNWSSRKTIVSTSGWLPGIEAITRDPIRAKLALSLNAVRDDLRSQLMPVNRRYPLGTLLPAIREFARVTGEQVSIEYILIAGVNDSPQDARKLSQMVKSFHSKVNLILYNPTPGLPFRAPDPGAVARFGEALRQSQVLFTQRTSRGTSIGAACGQLAGRNLKAAA